MTNQPTEPPADYGSILKEDKSIPVKIANQSTTDGPADSEAMLTSIEARWKAANTAEEIGIVAHNVPALCQIIRQLQGRVRELKAKLAIIEPLQKRWGEALQRIHNEFEQLNGRECTDRCGKCIKCIALDAMIPLYSENEPTVIGPARQSDSLRGEGKGEG